MFDSPWQRLTLPAALALWIVASLGEAHSLSFRDGLTRLPGRRAFDRELEELGRRFVIAMVDVDHFKRVNDRHGHDVGDQVLAKVAGHLAAVRGGRAYRYGGEEFAVIFRGRRKEDCEERLEELRRRISTTPFGVRGAKTNLKVTVSIGAAERSASHPQPGEVLAAADKALYRAKRAGRNRVQLAA
jgi:diguanylate cyclase (GGDEF)-like protein